VGTSGNKWEEKIVGSKGGGCWEQEGRQGRLVGRKKAGARTPFEDSS